MMDQHRGATTPIWSREDEQPRLYNMWDRQSSRLRNMYEISVEKQETSIRKLQVARLQGHRIVLLHFHSIKNFEAKLTTAFWGEVWKMLKFLF